MQTILTKSPLRLSQMILSSLHTLLRKHQDDESEHATEILSKLWIEKETALISVDPIDGANIFKYSKRLPTLQGYRQDLN